jgi:ornithine--oxo-acid transaminase
MNGGVESGETAIKFARRWGYNVKKVPEDKAEIVFPTGNFWGRTIAACGSSDDLLRYRKFGPFGGLGFSLVEYDNVKALEEKFISNPNIVAYFTEPIQGERGVIIPQKGKKNLMKVTSEKFNNCANNTTYCSFVMRFKQDSEGLESFLDLSMMKCGLTWSVWENL